MIFVALVAVGVFLMVAPATAQSVCAVWSGAPNTAILCYDADGNPISIASGGIGWGTYLHEAVKGGKQTPPAAGVLAYLLNPAARTVAVETAAYDNYYLKTFAAKF